MKILLIAIGTLKEKYFRIAYDEYAKRLSRYADLTLLELKEERLAEKPSAVEIDRALEREGAKIIEKVRGDLYVFDLAGRMVTSEEFADIIGTHDALGYEMTFVIGSSHGLTEAIKRAAKEKIAFGRVTFPHQMMRVIVLEQIYRAFKILRGENYHK